jgi:catechol 2,3-dioxygenase-like lactoylglutathione lyase family enzyme
VRSSGRYAKTRRDDPGADSGAASRLEQNVTLPLTTIGRPPVTRRIFLGALGAAAVAPRGFAQEGPPIPVTAINHMTINVSDPALSLEWYQGLFGMPIAARQADTVCLQVGDGPQFLAIGGGASDNPRINHLCLETPRFTADRITSVLQGVVGPQLASGELGVRVRQRGEEFGGHMDGTPELYFTDHDGIVIQLQDPSYCGGAGVLGEECRRPESAPSEGLLSLGEYNHFTLFVTDQAKSIALYQQLFGLPVDTYQGALPVLRVGRGNQFLALAGAGRGPTGPIIHHASVSVADFNVDRIFGVLEGYGLEVIGEAGRATDPLQAYVTMRGPERGGAEGGTPELYFTDPDGILIQLQDATYCGGNGYLGGECGTVENPTGWV